MLECPTPEQLAEFVRNGAEAEDLFEHVGSCERCGKVVEELCSSMDDRLSQPTQSTDPHLPSPQDLEFLFNLAARSPDLSIDEKRPGSIVLPDAESPEYVGTIDCYHVIRRIDGGGFGDVYEAYDSKLNRTVALKLLRASGLDADTLRQFQREAQAAGSINHENVVVLHRVIEPTDPFPYACLVMEYVRGGSLKERIAADEAIEIKQIVQWMIQAANGLSAVHGGGFLHRDLKPGNLLIDESDKLKLGDFGLARPLVSDAQASMREAGTPAYMSPEQMLRPDQLTVHSDIYGLGVVFYQLLTGVRPFQGIGEGLRKQIIESSPPSIRQLNPRVPRDLETICLRCLHKEPARRFESARAFADDLQSWLDGRPIASRPIGGHERVILWVRRHPTLATVIAGSVMIAIAASVTAWSINNLRNQAVASERIAIESRLLAARQQNEAIETLNLMTKELGDQLDQTRLVPIYEHFADQFDKMVWPKESQETGIRASARARLSLASIYTAIAPSVTSKNLISKANENFEEAIQLLEPLGDAAARDLMSAYDGLGATRAIGGANDEAEQLFLKVVSIGERLLAEHPDDQELQRSLGVAFESLADIQKKRGNTAARSEYMKKCIEIRERRLQLQPSPANQYELANALTFQGDILRSEGDLKAKDYYARSIALAEAATTSRPQEVKYWRVLANASDRMHLCCQGEESLSWSKRALLLREKISRLDPNGRTTVNDLLVSLLGLLPQTQDPVEAKRMLDLASEQAERWAELASEDPQSLIMLSRVCLAYCDYYSDEGNNETALVQVQRAVELRRRALALSASALGRRYLVVALKRQSEIQFKLDQKTAALESLREVLAIARQMVAANEYQKDMNSLIKEAEEASTQ